MKKKNSCYCLYTDKKQTNLLAMAYSEEQVIEETQYYSDGVWFIYDYIENKFLENEKIYKKKIVFPEVPQKRISKYVEIEEYNWIK